jgi:RNA polymerase sigma-70 factor (ECF subfamily)
MRESVEAARAGDANAWQTLFDAHYPKVFRYVRSRVESAQTAEDLASEAFLEAYRSIGRFRWQSRPFEAWLFGIARNRLLMHYRSRRPGVQLPDEVEHVRDEFLDVEIRDVLDRLPADYRAAIEYRYVLGLSGAEAAAAMGKSHGAFRMLLNRATKAFKAAYGRER